MSLCHLKSYILVVCHWKRFPKCAFSSACGSAPTYSWAFRSLEGVSKNSRRNLGTSEFRRLLNSSSASLARCFAQLGQICSARCATRLVGPSSLPAANIYLAKVSHRTLECKLKYLLQQLVCNLSEESVNVVTAFGRSLQEIHSVPASLSILISFISILKTYHHVS